VYAPLDTIKNDVRVVVVGITPGKQQAQLAVNAAVQALRNGADPTTACLKAKETAEFAGGMRSNLITMLDALGLHDVLGLRSTLDLFSTKRGLVNSTSALRYPVFRDGNNYAGSPDALSQHSLRWMLTDLLVTELTTTPDALIVPLGRKVDCWLDWLETERLLPRLPRLDGFPHPSPGNGHRNQQFTENRDQLRRAIAAWAEEAGTEMPPADIRAADDESNEQGPPRVDSGARGGEAPDRREPRRGRRAIPDDYRNRFPRVEDFECLKHFWNNVPETQALFGGWTVWVQASCNWSPGGRRRPEAHNLLRKHGVTIHRDSSGRWHFTRRGVGPGY
jgi:hypothetical protein